MNPTVSVVIPAYNCASFIRNTLDTVFQQTCKDYEVVVVDDGSTDNTMEVLSGYGDRIKLIRQGNKGNSAARNTAIRNSSGEYIAFLDHDDLWLPEKLEKQMSVLKADKSIGLVYSDGYVVDSNGSIITTFFESALPQRGEVTQKLFMYYFLPLLSVLVKKDLVIQAGCFPEDLRICEEWELFLKISEKAKMEYVDEKLVKYVVHDGNQSRNRELSKTEEIAVMQRALKNIPALQSMPVTNARKRFCNLYRELANIQMWKQDAKKARASLLFALKYKSDTLKILLLLMMSFCGPSFYNFMLKSRKRIYGSKNPFGPGWSN